MAHPPVVHSVVAKLARSEIAGVNVHTLPIALVRAERDGLAFDDLTERQVAISLLERIGYPETAQELGLFLNVNTPLGPAALPSQEITDAHAPHYMHWIGALLINPEGANIVTIQRNARVLLRWLVANRAEAIAANQSSLDNLRRLADDVVTGWKNSAFLVYALGICGTLDDYDRVTRHAELVIEHDRENIALIAEALYRLYPPALISALQYFLERSFSNAKQFSAGMHLLSKVAEIEDQAFWVNYYAEMDKMVAILSDLIEQHPAVERIVDQIEKHLALATSAPNPDEN